MADVDGETPGDRGQVILVTALLLASTLLVLVLVLNAVIYTENVATRGPHTDPRDANDYREAVVTDFEALLAAEHQVQRTDDSLPNGFDNLTERIDDAAGRYRNRSRDQWLDRGRLATFEYTLEEGILVWQDSDGDFDNGSVFVDNVDRSDNFTMEIDTTTVHDFGDRNLSSVTESEIQQHAGGLELNSDDWELRIFNVTNGTAVTDGGNTSICEPTETFDTDRLHINATNGTVDGTDCSGNLWDVDGLPSNVTAPIDVRVVNPQNVSGQYEFVGVGENMSSAPGRQWAALVNAAAIEITFDGARIRYVANTTAQGAVP